MLDILILYPCKKAPRFQPYGFVRSSTPRSPQHSTASQHIMPAEDYTPATSGTLKLKGVQNSKISKRKKRPKPPQPSSGNQDSTTLPPTAAELTADKNGSDVGSELEKLDKKGHDDGVEKEEISLHGRGKTEAQIRHEERRRKRV